MYELQFKRSVAKDLKKIGKPNGERILKAIKEKLIIDPKKSGIPLKGEDGAVWRFRVGDYRVLYSFNDDELVVLVIQIGHRREIYRS